MDTRRVALIAVMLYAVELQACGDDDASETPMAGTTGDAAVAGSSGAGSGGGGTGGTGGAGPAGTGGAAATTVECGSETCAPPAGGLGFVSACCADEATSTCGISVMGNPCTEPTANDPRCPSLDIMGFLMLPSCCTEGQCGIDASMFGMPGCIDLATAAERAEMMGGGMGFDVMIPAPRACDDGDGGIDDDAGS